MTTDILKCETIIHDNVTYDILNDELCKDDNMRKRNMFRRQDDLGICDIVIYCTVT